MLLWLEDGLGRQLNVKVRPSADLSRSQKSEARAVTAVAAAAATAAPEGESFNDKLKSLTGSCPLFV